MNRLSVDDVEYIAYRVAKELRKFREPIPDFSTRFPGRLESCLAAPFQKFGGKSRYRGLIPTSAALFYYMIKSHPFRNGNKRIAMTTMMVHLHVNNRWIKVDQQEFYNFAKWVAESPPRLKDEVIQAADKFIRTYIVPRSSPKTSLEKEYWRSRRLR